MISLQNISKQFGEQILFKNVSVHIGDGDRIAVVGPNGAGKSTLMKIIVEQIDPDEGTLSLSRFTTAGYLPQDNIYNKDRTLFDEVAAVFDDVNHLHKKIRALSEEMQTRSAGGNCDSAEFHELVDELGKAQTLLEHRQGYTVDAKIKRILSGLGFREHDLGRMTEEFSGGWQMRIELAKLLLQEPTVLLLDEPTNHLDIESLQWLETYLQAYRGSVVLVSHDSRFLDALVRRVIEISRGQATTYTGNFSSYCKQKVLRDEQLRAAYTEQQQLIERTERFVGRHRYDKKRAKQVQSRLKMLEKMERIELDYDDKTISFAFPETARPGKVIVELDTLTKSYGSQTVFKEVSLRIDRGDKIALLGINGSGKSTLARIIAGHEPFQGGQRLPGHNVSISYFAQNLAGSLAADNTVLETLETVSSTVSVGELRTLLGCFLFTEDDVFKPVGVLSGGEKSRLAIATMLLTPANLLIFDEPTNHLDVQSKAVLRESLRQYPGSYVIVSHDRDFLVGLIDKVIYLKDGIPSIYHGNVDDYLEKISTEETIRQITENGAKKPVSNSDRERKRKEAQKRQALYQKLKPLRASQKIIEDTIATKEERKAAIEAAFADENTYGDEKKIQHLHVEHDRIASRLEDLYDQWTAIVEQIDEAQEDQS